jgi:cell division protease FtsH
LPPKNRLKIWLRRIAVFVVIYTIYSWLFQLFAVCGQPVDPETGFAFGPGRDCTAGDALGNVPRMLASLLPLVFMAVYLFLFIGFQYGVFIYLMSRGRNYVIYPNEYDVTFDDVRGQRPVVESVQEVVKLFRGFREFKKLGGYPPHGILFEGPPGTGKTLMAKAVAGTVGVPFIYAPATGFANATFFGAGVLRLMLLFRKAKKFAKKFDGCVIFIDEIDAVGSRGGVQPASVPASESSSWMRFMMGAGMGGGGGTINELLVQMDGLVMPQRGVMRHLRRLIRLRPKIPSYNILIIAATNRAGALDPALLRPGRFDRKIHVGLPDKEGRKDIIEYYLAKVAHEGIDLDKFAQSTIGFSPAQIKNIINEGLIVALQDGRESLGWGDVWQAKLIEEIGLKQHSKYTPKEKEMTAVHEAGHAIASREFQSEDKQIQVISIVKRENTLGVVHTVDLEERFSDTKEEILEDIKVFLAGQAAEEIWFSTSTTGPSSDLYWCTVMALNYIGRYGMGKRLLSYSMFPPSSYFANENFYSKMIDDPEVREEVDALLKQCKAEVTTLLKKRKFAVEMIRDELLEHDELVGDQLEALMSRISDQVAASTPKPRRTR